MRLVKRRWKQWFVDAWVCMNVSCEGFRKPIKSETQLTRCPKCEGAMKMARPADWSSQSDREVG